MVAPAHTAAGKIPQLGQVTGRAAGAKPDFVVRGKDGAVKVVEAKFNTSGLTGAQRELKSQIGSAFTVSRTTMGAVAKAGGVTGAAVSGTAASATQQYLRKKDE